tara:strand:- start:11745 stop:12092 length:348 start_codon:yes stop_codon:yes gene_type:complete
MSASQWAGPVANRNPPPFAIVVFATWHVGEAGGATGGAKAMVPVPVGPTVWQTKPPGIRLTMSAWGTTEATHLKTVTSPVHLLGGAVVEVPVALTVFLMRVEQTVSGLAIKNQRG